jgi:carbamoyl-phosphate synthase large subunit
LREIKVLISAIGHPTSPGVIESIKNNGERDVKVIGVDMNPSVIIQSILDKFYQVPSYSDPELSDPHYIDSILEICKKEKIDVYYAQQEEEGIFSSKRKQEFEDLGVKVIRPASHEVLEISNNKRKFHEFFKKENIPHSNFRVINQLSELEEKILELGYPVKDVFLKPTVSVGGRGAILVSENIAYYKYERGDSSPKYNLKTIKEMFSKIDQKKFPELIAMEYLTGEYYSVDVLSKKGNVIYSVPKKRIKGNASNTIIGQVDNNEKVLEQAKKACKVFGFSFLQNYEMKMNEDGEPMIYDINPRGGASLAFCKAAGVNLMYYAIKMALGEEFPQDNKIKNNLKMIRGFQEYYENI